MSDAEEDDELEPCCATGCEEPGAVHVQLTHGLTEHDAEEDDVSFCVAHALEFRALLRSCRMYETVESNDDPPTGCSLHWFICADQEDGAITCGDCSQDALLQLAGEAN